MISCPAKPPKLIHFHSTTDDYGCFSNLYRRTMKFGEVEFPTAEHAYQWHKPRSPKVRDWLMAAPTPALLAMAAPGLVPDGYAGDPRTIALTVTKNW